MRCVSSSKAMTVGTALLLVAVLAFVGSGCSPAADEKSSNTAVAPEKVALEEKAVWPDNGAEYPSEEQVKGWFVELGKIRDVSDPRGAGKTLSDGENDLQKVVYVSMLDEEFLDKAPRDTASRGWYNLDQLLYLDLYQDKKLSDVWAEMLPSSELANQYRSELKPVVEDATESGDFTSVCEFIAKKHQSYNPTIPYQNFELHVLRILMENQGDLTRGSAAGIRQDEAAARQAAWDQLREMQEQMRVHYDLPAGPA